MSTIEKFKSLIPYLLLALVIIAAYRISGELGAFIGFFTWVWGFMAPFFYAFILAYIISLPCGFLQKLLVKTNNKFLMKRKKSISLITVLLLSMLIIAAALNWVIPAIVNNMVLLIDSIPTYWEGVVQLINNFNHFELFDLYISSDNVQSVLLGLLGYLSVDLITAPISVLFGAASAIFSSLIIFIASIYIIIEKERFKLYLNKLLMIFTSDKFRKSVIDAGKGLNKNFRQYIHTQTLGGVILSAMSMIALFFMGSPFALLIGIMLFVGNYVPYFGSIAAVIVAIIIVAFSQGLTMGLIAAVVLIIIQQVETNIIQPKLMSDAFSMSPLLIIISISVGGAIAGIMGMVVIIPIVAILKDFFDNIVAYYERKKFNSSINSGSEGN